MKRPRSLLGSLLIFLLSGSTAQAASGELIPAAEQLAELVRRFVARGEIVGAGLLVVHRGEPILHRALDCKDREAQQPMTPGTCFAIRSTTKPITGIARGF